MTVQFDKGRALVIGVADYPHAKQLPKNVLNDAQDIVSMLCAAGHCGYPAANVELLLDGQATADGIRQAISRLTQAASDDDTVLLFFSGHGGRIEAGTGAGEYLIPFDCKLSDLPGTGLSGEELTRLLNRIKVQRLVVLLDACHSAGVADVKSAELSPGIKCGLGGKTYSDLAQGTGRVVMASSRPTETSVILPNMRNSLFTHHLLDALKGAAQDRGDGLIRVLDVFHHVSDNVPAQQADQHPVFKAQDLENNFPLALRLGGKGAASLTQGPTVSTTTNPRSSAVSPKARLAIKRGLTRRWDDLADYLGIPLADKAKFQQGYEPQRVLEWLEERCRLGDLRDAFNYFGWDDLIKELDSHP
jgi:hypothetical protein